MSDPCGASVAELQRDTGPLHDQADLADAREYLKERLLSGETVKRLDLRDLIADELNGARTEFATAEVIDIVLAEHGEHGAKADKFVEGVIERFLETNEDLVAETADELAAEEPGS